MRLVALLTFLSFLLLVGVALAEIQYSVNVELEEDGQSLVKSTATFSQPEETLNFTIKGSVSEFNATSNAGLVSCKLDYTVITFVYCNLDLTKEKRTVYITYKTSDFVKISEKNYFDGDFDLNQEVDNLAVSVTLPEGMVPIKETEGIFPSGAVATWDPPGRKLTITWSLSDLSTMPRFQILYEKIEQPPLFRLRLRHFAIFGSAAATVFFIIYIRYIRKPEKMIISVLDEYERKVMDMIIASGGAVNQRKVVQETNFSKAKVSRVIKSLVERGLISAERMGRTNKIRILKKKFRLF